MRTRSFPLGLKKSGRIVMIISLAIFFFFSQIASYTLTAQAVDVTSSDSQFFDLVTVKDAKGQIVDGSKGTEPALTPGDEVTLTYEWSLKKDKKADSEQDINVELPKSFTFDKGAEGEIKSADQVIGSYQVPAGSSTMTVKLTTASADSLDAKGTITLPAKFTADVKEDEHTAAALFQLGGGKTQQVIIPVKKRRHQMPRRKSQKTTLLILRVIRKGKMTNLHLQSARIKKRKNSSRQMTLRAAKPLRVMIQKKCHPQVNQLSKACKLKKNKSRNIF